VVVPTGTASPWRELTCTASGDLAVYMKDGWVTESADLLAEALRADGVIRTLGPALRAAEEAHLEFKWYGYVDGGYDEELCDAEGETLDGEIVDEVKPCVLATVNVRE
jgi:hypothetical protein